MIGQDHQVIATAASQLRHSPDLGDPRIGAAQIHQRLLARGAEVVGQLVVLHESAVDDRHAEIDVEKNGHRLQLADDDVADDPDQRENPFGVRHPTGHLAASALPFLEQPLVDSLQSHASHSNRMQQHEQRHPASTESAIHRHLLARGDRERHCLRVAVEEIDVARSAGQCSGRVDAVANVLYAVRRVAGDHLARRLVVKAKRRNAAVLAVKHSRLTIRRSGREPAEPAPERESFAHQPGYRGTKSQLERTS